MACCCCGETGGTERCKGCRGMVHHWCRPVCQPACAVCVVSDGTRGALACPECATPFHVETCGSGRRRRDNEKVECPACGGAQRWPFLKSSTAGECSPIGGWCSEYIAKTCPLCDRSGASRSRQSRCTECHRRVDAALCVQDVCHQCRGFGPPCEMIDVLRRCMPPEQKRDAWQRLPPGTPAARLAFMVTIPDGYMAIPHRSPACAKWLTQYLACTRTALRIDGKPAFGCPEMASTFISLESVGLGQYVIVKVGRAPTLTD